MTERARVAMAVLAGAGLGGAFGFLCLTDAGRRVRDDLDTRLDEFIVEMRRLRATVEKARQATQEAWQSLDELVGKTPAPSPAARAPERLRSSAR